MIGRLTAEPLQRSEGSVRKSPLLLVVPSGADQERDQVVAHWSGSVLSIDRFWEPPPLDRRRVRLYGPDTFCLVLAQKLDLELVSPPDDLLIQAPWDLVQRKVEQDTLAQVLQRTWGESIFVKPLIPKQFSAGVYSQPGPLSQECRGLDKDTAVLVSQVVAIEAEARSFIMDGRVETWSIYEGQQELSPLSFLERCLAQLDLPLTCVLDLAYVRDRGWCLLEANATWGAGLNGCDAARVAACLEWATRAP